MTSASPLAQALDGAAPEVSISRDMVRRGLIVAPVIAAVCTVFWGADGAVSSLYALAIVLTNFSLAAASVAMTARISLGLMMGAALFGYLIRLGLIFVAVFLVRDASWVSLPALGGTLIVTHLGLLGWELKYIAASLAYPGLKPDAGRIDKEVAGPFLGSGSDRQDSSTSTDRHEQRRTGQQ